MTDEQLRSADVVLVADPADPSFLLPLRPTFYLGRMAGAESRMVGDLVILADTGDRRRQVTVLRQRIAALARPSGRHVGSTDPAP